MAIIKLAGFLSGIRGTVAGEVYSANSSGPYVRAWSRPPRQRSSLQSFQRALYSIWPAVWRDTLSAANRAAWNVYAAAAPQELTNSLGETYYANGYNWFVRLSTHLMRLSRSPIVTPPAAGTPATPTLDAFTAETGDVADTSIDYPNKEWDTFDMVLHIAQSRTAGELLKYSDFFEVHTTQTPDDDTETIQTPLEGVFGAVYIGQRYHLRAYRQSTEGRRSAPACISATVTQ